METKTRNGFVVIDGTAYRRSSFTSRRTSIKEWALFSLIMLGLAASVVLAVACTALLAWAGVEAIGAIGRQIQSWR